MTIKRPVTVEGEPGHEGIVDADGNHVPLDTIAAEINDPKSFMFDYIVKGDGDPLARALATIEHVSGHLGAALEENERQSAQLEAMRETLKRARQILGVAALATEQSSAEIQDATKDMCLTAMREIDAALATDAGNPTAHHKTGDQW